MSTTFARAPAGQNAELVRCDGGTVRPDVERRRVATAGEGTWQHALLADGNVGTGGGPTRTTPLPAPHRNPVGPARGQPLSPASTTSTGWPSTIRVTWSPGVFSRIAAIRSSPLVIMRSPTRVTT